MRRLKGNTWTTVGTPIPIPSTVDVTSVVPVLALDNTEQPVLAWSMPGKAEVWRWNGSAWMRVGELNQPVSGETSSPGPSSCRWRSREPRWWAGSGRTPASPGAA
ncbi:hypothetical protein ACN28S_09155 [Cystobacter fuscus]